MATTTEKIAVMNKSLQQQIETANGEILKLLKELEQTKQQLSEVQDKYQKSEKRRTDLENSLAEKEIEKLEMLDMSLNPFGNANNRTSSQLLIENDPNKKFSIIEMIKKANEDNSVTKACSEQELLGRIEKEGSRTQLRQWVRELIQEYQTLITVCDQFKESSNKLQITVNEFIRSEEQLRKDKLQLTENLEQVKNDIKNSKAHFEEQLHLWEKDKEQIKQRGERFYNYKKKKKKKKKKINKNKRLQRDEKLIEEYTVQQKKIEQLYYTVMTYKDRLTYFEISVYSCNVVLRNPTISSLLLYNKQHNLDPNLYRSQALLLADNNRHSGDTQEFALGKSLDEDETPSSIFIVL
ncbi:viral A-type inclusion protein [Reticulomyxa filosa]|uniref:Viral A-type inclusion protein n=1 Tax=Reticulomyxa filosa TaxID=46433 RepID=X6NPM6_RETFI|nr:viral A-type inclusion protein [Reticulomyxa filosa]|eukprot:ETO27332.1 viral A-type inclusion protein [Reticulomyxa filosa]